jgi:hypothetical protein
VIFHPVGVCYSIPWGDGQPLVTDVAKQLPVMAKCTKSLNRILAGDTLGGGVDDKEKAGMTSLVLLLEQIDGKHEKTHGWAITYGVCEVRKTKKAKV